MLTHPLWRSRIGAVATVTAPGAVSMLGRWMGGVSVTPDAPADTAGLRSMLRPWMGGVCAVNPAAPSGGGGGGGGYSSYHFPEERRRNDDEEVMELIAILSLSLWPRNVS